MIFIINTLFIVHISYLLYEHGIAFTFIRRWKEKFSAFKRKSSSSVIADNEDPVKTRKISVDSTFSSGLTLDTSLSCTKDGETLCSSPSVMCIGDPENNNQDEAKTQKTYRKKDCAFKKLKRRSMKSFNANFVTL